MSKYPKGICPTEGCDNVTFLVPGPPWNPAPYAYMCPECENKAIMNKGDC